MTDEIHYKGHLVDSGGNAIVWEVDPPVVAVLPDDSIVRVVDSIHAGAFGGNLSVWICHLIRPGYPGIFNRMVELPNAISRECLRRTARRKSNTVWCRNVKSLGLQVLVDPDMEFEAVEDGWEDILNRFQ
jgi:hypothetical protein